MLEKKKKEEKKKEKKNAEDFCFAVPDIVWHFDIFIFKNLPKGTGDKGEIWNELSQPLMSKGCHVETFLRDAFRVIQNTAQGLNGDFWEM